MLNYVLLGKFLQRFQVNWSNSSQDVVEIQIFGQSWPFAKYSTFH